MAVLSVLQKSLRSEVRKASQLLKRMGFSSSGSVLGANFRAYGRSFGVFDFQEFQMHARGFYEDALANAEPGYTILNLPNGRKAVDFRGEVRGIFSAEGEPLAYFRPNYKVLGFANPQDEIRAFKQEILAASA